MLRVLKSSLDSLATGGFNISANPVCVQSVRWRRKPRWLPMARSKLFKIPPRYILPEDEKNEWLRINQNYKAQMRSVRLYLREEFNNKKLIVAQELTPADEKAEFERCSTINDAWNLEIAMKRDERIAKENAERREFIKERLEVKKIKQAEELARIEARVKLEKENSATFITRDNIDQAIEQALANPVDYNFSVDIKGNIYQGDERPGMKKESPVES